MDRASSSAKKSQACRLLPVLGCALLGACASTAPGGRAQLTAPAGISAMSSSLDMSLRLAAAPVAEPCAGVQCRLDEGFDRQVKRLGSRLAQSAFEADPELKDRIPVFTFSVADKSEPGTASDASGAIVVYRGVRQTRIDEEALAFLIAREMGHVIARHHDEKSATRIIASLFAQLVFPAINLAPGLSFLASSAASVVGTEVISAGENSKRRQEADAIALDLLARQGWSSGDVANALSAYARDLGRDGWAQGVRTSLAQVEQGGPQIFLAFNQPAEGAPGRR